MLLPADRLGGVAHTGLVSDSALHALPPGSGAATRAVVGDDSDMVVRPHTLISNNIRNTITQMGRVTQGIRIADEVWIAAALLHREHPGTADFTLQEIKARLVREGLTDDKRSGVQPHVSLHCVANLEPNPATYRMLFETAPRRRRLFRPGDPYHPKREGGKMLPARGEIPAKYHPLLDWYQRDWAPVSSKDPLLALAARHRDLWKGVDPDDYVRQLRKGFE
jgi:hypothetical protein